MPKAEVVWVSIEPNKFNPEQTRLSIGFKIDGGDVSYQNYVIAGGSEGQQKFASMQLKKLLQSGGELPVNVEQNDRGYTDVYSAHDDGFRKGSGASDANAF